MNGAYRDELQAAIARAEAAERKLASVCFLHHDTSSAATCESCQRGICEACTMAALDGTFCPACFARVRTSRTRKQTAILAVAAIGIAAVAVMIVTLFTRTSGVLEPPPPAPKAADYDAEKIKRLWAHMANEPCDLDNAIKLAETLNNHGDLSLTAPMVDAFEAKCGPSYRLRWPKAYALEQQKEFAKAAEVDTSLIEHEPHDQDYWWWRGQNFSELGRDEEAAADYRQSLASLLAPTTVGRFATVMKRLGRPCEGAFAIQALMAAGGDFDPDSARERLTEMREAGDCPPLEGQARTTIKYKPATAVVESQVTVDKAAGHFFIDDSTGFVVVTKAFAERAGLVVQESPELNVFVAGAVRNARRATAARVSIGAAHATLVEIAVVDELPPKLDGVVGNSFLYRFTVENDGEGKLNLAPHGADAPPAETP